MGCHRRQARPPPPPHGAPDQGCRSIFVHREGPSFAHRPPPLERGHDRGGIPHPGRQDFVPIGNERVEDLGAQQERDREGEQRRGVGRPVAVLVGRERAQQKQEGGRHDRGEGQELARILDEGAREVDPAAAAAAAAAAGAVPPRGPPGGEGREESPGPVRAWDQRRPHQPLPRLLGVLVPEEERNVQLLGGVDGREEVFPEQHPRPAVPRSCVPGSCPGLGEADGPLGIQLDHHAVRPDLADQLPHLPGRVAAQVRRADDDVVDPHRPAPGRGLGLGLVRGDGDGGGGVADAGPRSNREGDRPGQARGSRGGEGGRGGAKDGGCGEEEGGAERRRGRRWGRPSPAPDADAGSGTAAVRHSIPGFSNANGSGGFGSPWPKLRLTCCMYVYMYICIYVCIYIINNAY